MYDYFLGIDPGLDGACVLLCNSGEVKEHYKLPSLVVQDNKRKLHAYGLYLWLRQIFQCYPKTLVCIEKINGSPGQGATSIFAMGHGAGQIEACVAIAGFPYEFVGPQKWKNRFLSGSKKEKDASVQKALELFPGSRDWIIGPKGGRDHNLADALFIAEYARSFNLRESPAV
jgi:hypothetical protein